MILHFPSLPSTNSWFREQSARYGDDMVVVWTDYQSAGRGQQGNSWESEDGKNLLFSIRIHPNLLVTEQFRITEWITLAIYDAILEAEPSLKGLTIKWPNDMYVGDKKIAGILVENILSREHISESIIGVGLNVNQTIFRSPAPNPTSLQLITGKAFDRETILQSILSHLEQIMEENTDNIHAHYLSHLYRRDGYHLYAPREEDSSPVNPEYDCPKSSFEAKIIDVDAQGRLLLEKRNGKQQHFCFKQLRYVMRPLFILLLVSLFLLPSCKENGLLGNDPSSNPSSHESNDSTISASKRNYAYLFDLTSVPEIVLSFTLDDWNTYLTNFDANSDNAIYVPAAFSFTKDGSSFHRDSVGVRPRGNTSRRRPESETGALHSTGAPFHHAHFGVRFTKYTTGERFFGVDRLILKWFKDDPSYAREIYCYDLFHRFGVWSAPWASFCRLSIYIESDPRPVYMGVYEMIENPRNGWLDSRKKDGYIPDTDGNLWKAAYGANLSSTDISQMGVGDDTGKSYVYTLKTNTSSLAAAQQELVGFIAGMTPLASGSDTLRSFLLQHMDVDLFLRAYAVNVMVGMWDDYWINQNNYYFYFDSSHKFYFIPFDYDNTLGTSNMIDAGRQNLLNWGSRSGDRILMRKVLSIAEFENQYKAYIKELASSPSLFSASASQARIAAWQQMISPYIENDTGEDMEIKDEPASWGNHSEYRIFGTTNNFFLTKINSINF